MLWRKDRRLPTVKPSAESKAVKHDQPVKSGPIMMNQYEAALEISNGQGISIIGPLGTVFIERSKDSKERVMLVVIADEELTVRRTVKEAVDIGLHLAGLSVASQIEVAGKKAATAAMVVTGKGAEILAKGLSTAAGVALKMGSLLVK